MEICETNLFKEQISYCKKIYSSLMRERIEELENEIKDLEIKNILGEDIIVKRFVRGETK